MEYLADLHIHTTASDGTDGPEALAGKAAELGLRYFSVTDHDTIDGTMALARLGLPGFIPGIEFSCTGPRGKCHILGYGFDPRDPVFLAALEEGCRLRREKLARRLAFLEERFGIVLTEAEMAWMNGQKSPGKPHLGRILWKRGLAPDLNTAIRIYVNPCRGGADRITAHTAIRAILHAGGVPVWAHPLGGEGERRLTHGEFEERLRDLMDSGIRGLECYYSRYSREDIAFLLERAGAHGLLISGGSDYHGANKENIWLGKLSTDHTPVDIGALTILETLDGKL